MKKMRSVISGILAVCIALSSLLAVSAFFLNSTLLSESFYLDIIATPTYMTEVSNAIKQDFRMQSSYSGIPEDVFAQTLSDGDLHTMLRAHIQNSVSYLNAGTEYIDPEYPRENIQKPMYAFLERYAIENGITLTAEDYAQVDEVIDDAGKVIQQHVCLIDLKLVIGRDIFSGVIELVRMTAKMATPSLVILILSLAILVPLWGVKNWRKWMSWMMVGLWFPGAIFAVPSLVLMTTGLTGRLSIGTPYLKYFVDSVLEKTNQYFLLNGLLIFTVSSIILVFLVYTKREKEQKKVKLPVLQLNSNDM